MARLMWVLLLAALWASAQRVEGVVTDSSTSNGIAGVKVELVPSPDGPGSDRMLDAIEGKAVYSTTTDSQGRFRIEDVADGFYTARYVARNYQDVAWAPKRNPAPPQRIQVSAASGNAAKLEGRMIHFGIMSGRLVNDKGDGVPNAMLWLSSGVLGLGVHTDKDGKFSLPITPGVAYTLEVSPQLGWKPPEPEAGSGLVLGWARTYYPGVASRDAAAKITLPSGGELSGVEMKLAAVPAHIVRGVLLNADGSPAPKVAVTLGEDAQTPALKAESKADGSFEFPTVVDGSWRFGAEVERDGVKWKAAQWIDVAGRDVEGVKLRLDAPFAVRLTMSVETRQGWPAPKVQAPRLSRVGRGPWPFREPPLPARPEPNGNLRLDPVYPGVYRFDSLLVANVAGYYLDAVRLGEAILPAPDIELDSGVLPLTLVYKTGGGTVRGTVEKCAAGRVALIPQDPALRWPAALRTARCDSKDRYEIGSVRPGEYYAQAFQPDGSSELWEPKFDDAYLNQATRITVRAGESTDADMRVIGRALF